MLKNKKSVKRVRNLEQTRSHILSVAFGEVFAKGFQGVSVDDIVEKTEMTKGAFYHHFPTKLDLGYALVDEILKPMILDRWITPLAAYKNPLVGILRQIQKHIGESSIEELKFGCPLNNLVQEMSPVDPTFKTRLQAALELWVDETEKHLKRGQEDGYISKNVNVRQVARFVVMAHEGFFSVMKGMGDRAVYDSFYNSLKIYFDGISASNRR